MPPIHCPRCGKRFSAYQRQLHCSGCGWQPVPEQPPYLPPIRRRPTTRDPWWYRWEYYQGLVAHYLVVVGWQLWRGLNQVSDRLGLTRALYYRLSLLYLVWGAVTVLPVAERWLWQGWRMIAIVPMLLTWGLLYCCVRLMPFPTMKNWSPELRRWVQQHLLRLAPFLRRYTVTGSQVRPQWVAIQWWVCLGMILLGMVVGSFLLGLTGLIVAVVSFVSLLF